MVMALSFGLISCGGDNTGSNVEAPGGEKDAKTKTLEAGADLLQDKGPLKKVNAYLDGFRFYNGNINAQMEAHHYVSQINGDMYQAIMYDGNGSEAKIMGPFTSTRGHHHHQPVKSY